MIDIDADYCHFIVISLIFDFISFAFQPLMLLSLIAITLSRLPPLICLTPA